MAEEPTGTEAAGGDVTADNDKKDDEVVLGAFTLEELALGGGSSGPYACAFEAGVGLTGVDEAMANGTGLPPRCAKLKQTVEVQ